ncbi:polyamine ABC transporter substrate-binding protein [Aurantimonas sp. A3-2-R12]|uniref:polyamine ABC transporter substrate-binding protein n=1 Tax=Aurantimonas sp. A3-2-R12 TaxID=3114362 RepID=UPI002E1801DB|nr:polyamine ABC transporter substrate-binding protein [Aurantimonas sp. A3-2-R12]
MRRTIAVIGATVLAMGAAGIGAASAQEEKVVNVYNWSDYIDDSILEEFTKETGIKVVYDVYDSNDILDTKLFAGGSGYDVVVPSTEFLVRQIEAGLMQPLDKSKLNNLGNMWDVISERVAEYDKVNDYSVNYMWGTTGIGYNQKMVDERLPNAPTDSWGLIFDPQYAAKLADCGIMMLDGATEVIPAALNYLGLDPDSTKPEDIQAAEDALLKVRPYVRKFHSSEYINALANGDICVAYGYSGDIFQARDRAAEAGQGVEIKYSIPKEGARMWFDQLAIPADAPHPVNAHIFINYLMRPEVIAKATNYVVYANGNKASQEFVDPAILNDKAVYPDDDTLAKLYTKEAYDAGTQRLVNRAFTTVTTGQ